MLVSRVRRGGSKWSALLCATACIGASVGVVAGGSALQAAQPSAADQYLALIDAYQSGDSKAAVQALSDREDRWVERAQSAVMRTASSWPRARIEAGILLHTETVTGGWVLPSHVPMHLDAARRLIELSRGTVVPPRFRHDWLLAICWHFQSEMELGGMLPWLDELRARFPDDPEVLLAAGTFYETVGWTDVPLPDLPWTTRSKTLGAIAHRNRHDALEAAVGTLQRAAQSDATRTQATVRLGRVLAELGRPDAARATLAPVVADANEKRWRYLAALFTALAEARAGRPTAEAAAYERAAQLMPGCQTPLIGLTALRRLQGQTDEAAELARALMAETKDCDDPWWFYRFGQPPDRLPQLLADLRAAIGQ